MYQRKKYKGDPKINLFQIKAEKMTSYMYRKLFKLKNDN